MKKTILLFAWVIMCSCFCVAAPADGADKIMNTQIVQAAQDTTLTYANLNVFIPAGQTVILGSTAKGNVILRGQNLKGVKVGDGTITTSGPVVLAVQPSTQVIHVMRGSGVMISDKKGRTAELSSGASMSVKDIRKEVQPTLPPQTVTVVEAADIVMPDIKGVKLEEDLNKDIASFVMAAEASASAFEQKGSKKYKKKKRKK